MEVSVEHSSYGEVSDWYATGFMLIEFRSGKDDLELIVCAETFE
jgi:hypothetical protein